MENVPPSWLESYAPKRRRKEPKQKKHSTVGRPPLTSLHAGFVQTVSRIVSENGYEAHRRRRSSIGTCGSTLSSIRDQLLESEPKIAMTNPSLSLMTVSRILQPPNKRFRAEQRYKGYVQAKVPPKRNDAKKSNENAHFYSARVKYCMEAVSMFPAISVAISVDNKNKVKMSSSAPAVDRRISINRIFPVEDAPNLLDHDFPTPGYLITPSGYLEMKSTTSDICYDEFGREHLKLPSASSINLFLRGPKDSCNMKDHMDDLVPIMKRKVEEGAKFIVIIADGGPDFNPNHVVNQLYWMRMFQLTGLVGMIVTTYCPGFSALNPIEHLWAPLTNSLAGVYLPDTLENESQPPSLQTNLTVQEREDKEDVVFNEAMDLLIKYWSKVKWAGLRPNVRKIPSRSTSNEEYKCTHRIVNGPLKGLTAAVEKDYTYMTDHMDRRVGQLIFSQCGGKCGVCLQKESLTEETKHLLHLLRKFPSPAPDASHQGHMLPFLEAIKLSQGEPDVWMPRVRKSELGRCPHCRCHIFTSESDRKRHIRMFHH